MDKKVGIFEASVSDPYPCWITINDDNYGSINLKHRDIADLEHLIKEIKKAALIKLPDQYKIEV
jgi:hypothetical protein